MQRREFISLLGGASVLPIAARAQQQAMPVVGFLHVASAGAMSHLVAAFRQGLKDSGGDGNVPMEFRWAEGNYDRLQTLAADLVSRRVAVIITGGGENPALAAKAATSTIPIVFNIGNDPVRAGLVSSIGGPGRNITGVNILTTELQAKTSGAIARAVAESRRRRPSSQTNYPPTGVIVESVEAAARTLDRRIMLLKAGT
jgi:putative tryptophan/tyrosine transport system substrate-binding protein